MWLIPDAPPPLNTTPIFWALTFKKKVANQKAKSDLVIL
jgi:hypothetical protein